MKSLQGLSHTMFILGGSQSTVNLGRIHEDFAMITSDSIDLGEAGQLTVNLGRIHKDFTSILSDSVYPGEEGI